MYVEWEIYGPDQPPTKRLTVFCLFMERPSILYLQNSLVPGIYLNITSTYEVGQEDSSTVWFCLST